MNGRNLRSLFLQRRLLSLLVAWAAMTTLLHAQTALRYLGTVTGISGSTLTVKTDAGEVRQVEVPDTALVQRVEPGQKNLSAAVKIQLSDLTTGDRVLVKLDAGATVPVPQAAQIITIKSADLAARQQKEREQWQLRGVGGLVKSVDTGTGTIEVTSGVGAQTRTVDVHVGKNTVLKRYAPASVRYDLAQAAPISAIHVGDQLRARGQKNAAGTEIEADEVVSGSFRNISGIIDNLNAANSTIEVKDLLTKKPVTIHIPGDAQMRALPEMMARMMAARLKGESGGEGARMANAPSGGQQRNWPGAGSERTAGAGRAENGNELQTILNRAPLIQFSGLKKGDAVMLVSTEGTGEVTAITLLTGVEPLLQAPEASQNLLSSWSMGSGGAAEAAAQ